MPDDVGRLLRTFFDSEANPVGDSCWQPSADVCRNNDTWLVKLDLAGVRPDDISLRVDRHRLVISGRRRDVSVLENQRAYSMEISYNSFQRCVELPIDVESARIDHQYRDGMFLILIRP